MVGPSTRISYDLGLNPGLTWGLPHLARTDQNSQSNNKRWTEYLTRNLIQPESTSRS